MQQLISTLVDQTARDMLAAPCCAMMSLSIRVPQILFDSRRQKRGSAFSASQLCLFEKQILLSEGACQEVRKVRTAGITFTYALPVRGDQS
jgi:hypothetical protein